MIRSGYIVLALLGTGCAMLRPGIRSGRVSVVGVKDAGKPATLQTGETKAEIEIPAQTPVTVTKVESTPATEKNPFIPAQEVFQFTAPAPTKIALQSSSVQANTGTVDQTVALKKIEAGESRILLYASLVAAVLGGLFVYIEYPTPALMSFGAAVVFFLAWKLAGLPEWFYLVGAVCAAGAFFLWRGHERGELHAKETSK